MREEIGRAAVMFAGPRGEALFDSVAFLPGGILRTAQVTHWQTESGWCEAETSVRYHPPGSWLSASPRDRSGTLFVDDHQKGHRAEPFGDHSTTVLRLGVRLTEDSARELAVTYLLETYRLHRADAQTRVGEHFGTATEFVVSAPDDADENSPKGHRVIRFIFESPPAASKEPAAVQPRET
jgi:hypothetical protein